jgi:GxxExxY protein
MRKLGVGFLETVYENALCLEFDALGIPYERQKLLEVHYNGHIIGSFKADIIVDNKIIVEVKAIKELNPACEAQLYNYLAITGLGVGYLLNCGEARDYKRLIRKAALKSTH